MYFLLTNCRFFIFLLLLLLFLPAGNQLIGQSAPGFTSTPVTNAKYGANYIYEIEADDPDGDRLKISIEPNSLPKGLLFNSYFSSATIKGTPKETGNFPIVLTVRELMNPISNGSQSFTLGVEKEILTVTADDKTITYGEPIPELTLTYDGFVNGDDESDLDTAPTASTTANALSTGGTYPITVSGGNDDDYSFNYVNGTLTILNTDQTITFDPINDKTYGDPDFTLSATASSGLPVSFSVISGNATISGNTLTITGAGEVTVEAIQEGNETYDEASAQQSFTVSKASLIVEADDKTITYGEPIPELTLTYDGFVNGDDESDLDTAPTASTTANASSTGGTYPITVSGGNDEDYSFNYVNGTLAILNTDQTITFDPINDKTYGDPAFTLSATASSGLPVSFSVISGNASISGNTLTITGAGEVTVEAIQEGNETYDEASAQQSFTVSKAFLIVAADDKTITYGEPIPTLTLTYNGFVYGDNESDLDTAPSSNTTANASSTAGTYTITVFGGNDEDYSFNYVNGTLTILNTDQTITFESINDKTYGDPDFTLSATASSGLPVSFSVISGNATISGNTLTITGAGEITVEAIQEGNETYDEASAQQSFTVSKATLIVAADDKTITYGEPIPTLTLTYDGFVNEDDESDLDTAPTASTTANASSTGGTYPITVSGGDDEDYSFNYVNGTLSILKTGQTITFDAISDKTFGDPPFNLSASSSSGLSVSFSVISGNASISGNTLTINGAGDITVKATQAGNENYQAAEPVERSFTVEKVTASISITNLLQNFDGTPKEVSVNTTPEGLSYSVTYNGSSTAPSASGSYEVEVNINEANYAGSETATLIINNAPQSTGLEDIEIPEDSDPFQIDFLDYFTDAEDEDDELSFEIISNTKSSLFTQFSLIGSILNISLTPHANGTSTITVKVTDSNGMTNTDSFDLIITPVQDDPVFTSEPLTEVNQGDEYRYEIEAEDYDEGDALTITNIVGLPNWLSLTDNNDGTALLVGTPANNNVGSYGIALRVSDDNGNYDDQFFDLEVINVNDPPFFTSTPITQATLNVQYTYNITTNDIDVGDEVTLSIIEKPSWLTFTALTDGRGQLQGTPNSNDRTATKSVKIQAEDLEGATALQEFTLEVDFPNSAPVFTSTPITTAVQDQEYIYQVTVTDADNDEITITALVLPDWLNFETNSNTASISGVPENQDVGSHTIVLEAEDFLGSKSTQSFTITVENINDPPIITSEPATSAIQNILYEYIIVVEDPDVGDEVSISINQKPEWLNFDGEFSLSGTPDASDVENSPFSVSITATDLAGATDNQTFEIIVRNENLPPTIGPVSNPEPILEDNPNEFLILLTGISTGGESNQQISITVSTDLPGLFEYLEVIYTSPESNATLKYKVQADSFGIATVTIRLEDDGPENINVTEEIFIIEVKPVNDVPEFLTEPISRAQADNYYSYEIITSDADPNDILTINVIKGPAWLEFTDRGDGTAVLEGQVPESAVNEEISLRVTDLENESAEQNFQLQINQTPVITDIQINMLEDIPYEFSKEEFENAFSDANDDPIKAIRLTWTTGSIESDDQMIEPGQEINFSEVLNLQYIPPANFFGETIIKWTGTDGYQFSEEANIIINIDSVNDAPVLSNIETTTIDYTQGSGAKHLTESITVSDVDDQFLDSAFVSIIENYNPEEDRILFNRGDLTEITGSFNRESGNFLMTGKATKSDYEAALRSVSYENINSLTTDEVMKSVSIVVSDGRLRSEDITRQIKITNVLPELSIVNAFTPDGSGVNDTWDFVNLEVFELVKISVYNNKGILLYNCNSKDCEWDGTYNGKVLPAGTYFYLIDLNNGRRKYEGTVTILK